MNMINNMTSVKTVIAKIIADLGLDENDIKITDIKEWIFEALAKIGSVNQLCHKTANIAILDYQAKLPCDLEKLDMVAYSCCNDNGWIPMKKVTNSFGLNKQFDLSCCNMIIKDNVIIPLVKNLFNLTNDKDALDILNKDTNVRQTLSALVNLYTYCGNNYNDMRLEYMLKPGYIITNIKDGFLKISYFATYTDDEGLPMIPDIPSYHEAIYWYVAMKLLYIDYFSGRKPQHLYYDAKRSWNFYRQLAYAESLMPDSADLENIKNTWHTLVPERDEYHNSFNNIGNEQIIYNWN